MQSFYGTTGKKTCFIQLKNGDYLLESINEVIQKEGLNNAVLISGLGTLDQCEMHVVTRPSFPSVDKMITWKDNPIEVSAMSGIIADGVPHIHMVISTYKDGIQETFTGHLEDGCRVLYLMELAFCEIDDIKMRRVKDQNGINILGIDS